MLRPARAAAQILRAAPGADAELAPSRPGSGSDGLSESLLTELAIVMVVRTRRSCFRSPPGRFLWMSSCVVALVTVLVPWMPGAAMLGFVPQPPALPAAIVGISGLYLLAAELGKQWFWRHLDVRAQAR